MVTISTCNYASEYAPVYSVVSGRTYRFTSSISTDFLSIRSGTYTGTCRAAGTTPLIWTADYSGTVYLHINTNSSCGTASGCRTTTVQCTSCPGAVTIVLALPIALLQPLRTMWKYHLPVALLRVNITPSTVS